MNIDTANRAVVAADPSLQRRSPVRGSRRRRHLLTLLACFAAAAGCLVVQPTAAVQARDANCTLVQARGSRTVTKYIFNAGWGWTAWRQGATATVYDRCNHGSARVVVSASRDVVARKGGTIWASAWYEAGGRWYPMRMVNSWPSFEFADNGHVDLSPGTRITRVWIAVTVWTKANASGWVGLAGATTVCTMSTGVCRAG